MFDKLKKRYIDTPQEVKAAMWYTVSNIIQKLAPWLVMMILTRTLSTEQYGMYAIFMLWTEIIEIIVTLRIYSNGYVAGLVQNYEDRQEYTVTVQKLMLALISIWFLLFLFFNKIVTAVLEIDFPLMILMILSFYATTAFGLWASRQRVDNNYKAMLAATLVYGVLGPVIGALSVFLDFENPLFYVLAVRIVIQLLTALPFLISNLMPDIKAFNMNYAKSTLRYNLPLIPYYLSMVLLNQSDRIMIQKMEGYEEAAIYSVAYSISMMVTVLSGALILSLQPWIFKGLKHKESGDKSRLITSSTLVVAAVALLIIVVAPEAIFIISGNKYLPAIWVIPPIALSAIVMFVYQQYVNVLFYFKRTGLILLASIISAGINIGLNIVFIPIYGYRAAGYTTLFSYLVIMLFYYVSMKKCLQENDVDYGTYFDIKKQMGILISAFILALAIMFFYKNIYVRAIVVVVFIAIAIIKRDWLISTLKGGKNER